MSRKEETGVKKQVTILATSILMIVANKEAVEDSKNPRSKLARVLCIRYSINFRTKFVLALFDLSSKINAVYPTFAKELGLSIKLIDIGVQKIDSSMLDTYGIVVTAFLVTDKTN